MLFSSSAALQAHDWKGDAMPSSDWRSPAAYAHAKSIPAAGFAWEYLRRDADYRRDFHRVSAGSTDKSDTLSAFSERWGLRFPGRSRSIGRFSPSILASGAAS
ncbi:transcriptional regulator domain-containing protein [Bosea massiliensis]|uniref:Transcriptional regulator domain-containing protein n=1 Tax=Bosea massiliensis TaxID=151419 RepID=A0ABW0P8N1_9HYPH